MRKPSDNGLQCVADMVGVWDKLAIALGVPMVKIKEYRHQSLSSITSLLYWRNGSTGNPVTWKFLLDKVQGIPDLGQPMAEDIEKGITANPDWTDSGTYMGSRWHAYIHIFQDVNGMLWCVTLFLIVQVPTHSKLPLNHHVRFFMTEFLMLLYCNIVLMCMYRYVLY